MTGSSSRSWHRLGVAKGKIGTTHELTEAKQGKYHYTMGPYSDPVLHIRPGDRIVVETRDAFEGAIQTESDKPTARAADAVRQPAERPDHDRGRREGRCARRAHRSRWCRAADNPRGTCCMIPEFGALTGTHYTATLNDPLPEMVRKIHVDEEHVRLERPRHAALQAAYRHAELLARDRLDQLADPGQPRRQHGPAGHGAGQHHLPAGAHRRARGCSSATRHACQGDGEVCGTAVEYPTTTTIHVDLIKGWTIEWPRLETEDVHHGHRQRPPAGGRDAHRLSRAGPLDGREYGFDQWDAYMMLSQCGKVRLGNFVDPKYTVGAAIAKKYLTP